MAELSLPATEERIREIRVGTSLELSGRMITGRDAAHKWLLEEYREEVAPFLEGTIIYHCGPAVRALPDGSWEFVAAGQTTSIRAEPYQADVLQDCIEAADIDERFVQAGERAADSVLLGR